MVSGILIGRALRATSWLAGLGVLAAFQKLMTERKAIATATITRVRYHPVKSMAGIETDQVTLDEFGVINDRRYMVVEEESGDFVTARTQPRLVLLHPEFNSEGHLVIQGAEFGAPLTVPPPPADAPTRTVTVWEQPTPAADCGDTVAARLSAYLDMPVRLVTVAASHARRVPRVFNDGTDGQLVAFCDGFPFLMISEASLADLNSRLDTPVSMRNFRPNFVVSGCDAFAEDRWREVRINGVHFYIGKACTRCVLTTVNPDTGVKGLEPLKTLQKFRKSPGKLYPLFGVNMTHRGLGSVRVGDTVEVLSLWPRRVPEDA